MDVVQVSVCGFKGGGIELSIRKGNIGLVGNVGDSGSEENTKGR